MFKNVSIIGDGAMGTVLSMLLCEKGISVRMWGYDAKQLKQIEQAGENKKFLPGYRIPKSVVFEPRDEEIMKDADLVISAVPCQYMRGIWERLKDVFQEDIPIVSVAKGIEKESLLRPSEILFDILGDAVNCAVLSGPTIADELARRLPAVACAASRDAELAKGIQYTFSISWIRIYTSTDLCGVELASACKNIIAIAAGIIDGIGAGDNAKAALLSRGLAEIRRLGASCGARAETFAGVSGLGDLVTTCISPKGRNRSFGERIGKGQNRERALAATDSVVEGVESCRSVIALAEREKVDMPITRAVYEVLFEEKPVREAISDLMQRRLRAE